MVLIIYKKTEKNTFSVECSTEIKVSTLLTKLIESISFTKISKQPSSVS